MNEIYRKYATDLETLEKESELEFFKSSGPGGQNVDKCETAVRLRHLASGIVIEVQEERSQWRNREIAFERLQDVLRKLNYPPKPRKKTKVPFGEKIKRLARKRRHSAAKELRKGLDIDEI